MKPTFSVCKKYSTRTTFSLWQFPQILQNQGNVEQLVKVNLIVKVFVARNLKKKSFNSNERLGHVLSDASNVQLDNFLSEAQKVQTVKCSTWSSFELHIKCSNSKAQTVKCSNWSSSE